jgi:hypothetical protein
LFIGHALVLLASIRLGSKGLEGTNTLAYLLRGSVKKKKKVFKYGHQVGGSETAEQQGQEEVQNLEHKNETFISILVSCFWVTETKFTGKSFIIQALKF